MNKDVSKKRKYTKTYKKKPKKSEKTNKWAPRISVKEYKYIDNILQATSISTAIAGGTIVWLNSVNQGSYSVNRIGTVYKMKSLHFKGIITVAGNPTVPVLPTVLRFAIVYDAQPNNSVNAAELPQVFQSLSTTGATETTVFSGVNIGNRSRFTILRDYTRVTPRIDYQDDNTTPKICMDFNTIGAKGNGSEKTGQSFYIDDFIPINMPCVSKANPTGSSYSDISTGALLLYCYSGSQTGNWIINHGSRLTFKEEQN